MVAIHDISCHLARRYWHRRSHRAEGGLWCPVSRAGGAHGGRFLDRRRAIAQRDAGTVRTDAVDWNISAPAARNNLVIR